MTHYSPPIPWDSLVLGQPLDLTDKTQSLESLRSAACQAARRRGWKIRVSKKTGRYVVTRMS